MNYKIVKKVEIHITIHVTTLRLHCGEKQPNKNAHSLQMY